MKDGFKTARTTMFEMETLVIISKVMEERHLNFSRACNFLIKQGEYLLRKVTVMRQEAQQHEALNK